jgi:hypothetical protein
MLRRYGFRGLSRFAQRPVLRKVYVDIKVGNILK